MSARQFPALEATAFQVAALLEQYETDVETLASTWMDPALYARVSRQVDELRLACASQPLLVVPWVQLLIAHAELMHCLWRCEGAAGDAAAIGRCQGVLVASVQALRRKCLSQFSRALQLH